MENDNEENDNEIKELPYAIAELHLYLCNCPNVSSRVDYTYHAHTCDYRIWYVRRLRAENASKGKE